METQRFYEKFLCDALRLATYFAERDGARVTEGIGAADRFPGGHQAGEDIRFLRVERDGVTLYEVAFTTDESPDTHKHRNKGIHRVMIGEEVRRVREEKGMSLKELSEKTGFKAHSLLWIEQGRYDIDVTQLGVILDALGAEIKLV